MTRAHLVKKARKDNPVVKKGESYFWWQFPYGSKQYSKTQPTRSQLTQSGFLQTLYVIEDNLNFDPEDLEASRDNLVSELEQLRDECQESLDNMPEHLQDTSSSGEILQERISQLEDWISQLEGVEVEPDSFLEEVMDDTSLSEEEREEAIEDLKVMKVNELEECNTF